VTYARERNLPLFCAFAGDRQVFEAEGSIQSLCLRRGALTIPVGTEMRLDPALMRHRETAIRWVRSFQPDLIHVTGPGEMGLLGYWVSQTLGVPIVASWHRNLPECVGERLRVLPQGWRKRVKTWCWQAMMKFYGLADFVASPNEELRRALAAGADQPSFHFGHGVDLERFSRAERRADDGKFCVGYVGRLTPEKNVRMLAEVEGALLRRGGRDVRMLVVGAGSEERWLRANLRRGEFPGVLEDEALVQAYGQMDVLVVPSQTDSFGLAILEAMAAGVPVVVTEETGRRAGVMNGVNGLCTSDLAEAVVRLMEAPALRDRMGRAGREQAASRSWEAAFEGLQAVYLRGLARGAVRVPIRRREELLLGGGRGTVSEKDS
jgi:glycosyltransferase involved in cell wall biosynthesis